MRRAGIEYAPPAIMRAAALKSVLTQRPELRTPQTEALLATLERSAAAARRSLQRNPVVAKLWELRTAAAAQPSPAVPPERIGWAQARAALRRAREAQEKASSLEARLEAARQRVAWLADNMPPEPTQMGRSREAVQERAEYNAALSQLRQAQRQVAVLEQRLAARDGALVRDLPHHPYVLSSPEPASPAQLRAQARERAAQRLRWPWHVRVAEDLRVIAQRGRPLPLASHHTQWQQQLWQRPDPFRRAGQ